MPQGDVDSVLTQWISLLFLIYYWEEPNICVSSIYCFLRRAYRKQKGEYPSHNPFLP